MNTYEFLLELNDIATDGDDGYEYGLPITNDAAVARMEAAVERFVAQPQAAMGELASAFAAYDAALAARAEARTRFRLFDYANPTQPSQEDLALEAEIDAAWLKAGEDIRTARAAIDRLAACDPTLRRLREWVSLR
jgi:hypothetical protein